MSKHRLDIRNFTEDVTDIEKSPLSLLPTAQFTLDGRSVKTYQVVFRDDSTVAELFVDDEAVPQPWDIYVDGKWGMSATHWNGALPNVRVL